MRFQILGEIRDTEVIASGKGVRARFHLRRSYGGQRWQKLKGIALIQDETNAI